jgi:hypothetical protein
MNKRKRVAHLKHLKKRKQLKEKEKAQASLKSGA